MKVQELLMNIKQDNFDLENALEIKKYLPIEVKKTIAEGIVYECLENIDGVAKINSVQKYLSYVRYMITMHTNLEYTDNDYDAICSAEYHGARLLDAIIKCFENDAKECKKILNFIVGDYKNEASLESSVFKFLNGLNIVVSKFANKIEDVDVKSLIPDNVDMDKLGTFLNNYIK